MKSDEVGTVIPLMSAALLVAAWLAPNHYLPWTGFHNEVPAALSLVLLLFATLSAKVDGERLAHVPSVAIMAVILALVPLAQYLFGIVYFFGDAMLSALYLAGFGISCLVGFSLARQLGAPRVLEWFALTWLVGALLSMYPALHQWLDLGRLTVWVMDMPPGGRPYANLAQPNNLATLFAGGVGAALYLRERGRLGSTTLLAAVAMLFCGIAMTRSRSALVVMLVVVVWSLWARRRTALKTSSLEFSLGFVALLLIWMAWPSLSHLWDVSAESSLTRVSAAAGDVRFLLWRQLADAAFNGPLFGYGWNQVSIAQMAATTKYPHSVLVAHSHNLILDLLLWNGLLLGGAVLVAMAFWLRRTVVLARSLEAWLAVWLLGVVLTHGLLELPHAYTYFLFPVGFGIGVMQFLHGGRTISVPRWLVGAVGVCGGILVMWLAAEYLSVESDIRDARFEAAGFRPAAKDVERRSPVLLDQLNAYTEFVRMEPTAGMTEDALWRASAVVQRYPSESMLFRSALLLGLNHRYSESHLALHRLKSLSSEETFVRAMSRWEEVASEQPQLRQVPVKFEP